jgi:regulator of protease activity HflC (stomatin/prohibitin superfamily)
MTKKHIALVILLLVKIASPLAFYFTLINTEQAFTIFSCAFMISFLILSIRISVQWEKAVVLRLGKYVGLKGPGIFFLIPFIDRVDQFVDQRIRVTDISANKTLSKDTVPVNVDAVIYWTVWDVEKAALEVENYREAISYIAETALRDTIGTHELADLLQNREKIAKDLQENLDKNTNPWGITVQTVGIKDIIIPPELSNAMSKQAQAERERQARVTLGTAELEIADKFEEASLRYKNNPVALQLRGMNMLFEGLKERGSLIIVPSSALDSMNLGAIGGVAGLAQHAQENNEQNSKTESNTSAG